MKSNSLKKFIVPQIQSNECFQPSYLDISSQDHSSSCDTSEAEAEVNDEDNWMSFLSEDHGVNISQEDDSEAQSLLLDDGDFWNFEL